jgi:hypothetical protein
MHGGDYAGLVSLVLVIISGAVCLFSFLIFVVVSHKHSVHGVRGLVLYLLITVLLISLAAAMDNLFWDVFKIRNQYVSACVCITTAYLIPLVLITKLYHKEHTNRINGALQICTALIAVLMIAWLIAEKAI